MEQEEKNWKSIDELLSATGKVLNILEEEIDINVQRQYIALARRLLEAEQDRNALLQQARGEIDRLFDETTPAREKKKLLLLLAAIEDVSVYRAIETFARQKTPLKKWATIALQQSRMLIQSTLSDDATVFVSTGLGGHGADLRYFCVFITNLATALQPYQRDIVQKEVKLAIDGAKGTIERFEFLDRYITLTALLSIHVNLQEIFKNIIDECNTYGHFLREQMIVTNVKKLTVKEIDAFLHETESGKS
jgi:hypothetical protein